MTRNVLFLSVLVLAGTAAADFNGPYMLDNWSAGTILDGVTALSRNPGEVAFSYTVSLCPGACEGVNLRTATFSAPAAATGLVTFNWNWTGYHAYFFATGVLKAFADGPGGTTLVTLYNASVSGPFSLSGTASITINAGYNWGITVGGSNDDSDSTILGTVKLSNLDARAGDFTGAYEMENWSSGGITGGTTSMSPESCASGQAAFHYDVNLGYPGPGVSPPRTAKFFAPAQATGLATLNWNWTGYHAYFQASGLLKVFADGPGGTTTNTLFNGGVSGPFNLSGSASITVNAGYNWGIIIGGGNLDIESVIDGTVTVSNLVAPHLGFNGPYDLTNWSNTGITGGTTDEQPAGLDLAAASADLSYDVNLGVPGGGVEFQLTTMNVPAAATGTVTFDYSWTGFHAWFLATGVLQVYAIGPSGETTVNLFNDAVFDVFHICGTASIEVTAGYEWGIAVGGSNADSTSLMSGAVTISNLQQCVGDINADGQVGVQDFLALLAAWGPQPSGHPADLNGDGNVNTVDFLALLAHWGPCPG